MQKYIQIWYSWGDQESPVEVPEDVDAWEYMVQLATSETKIEIKEKSPANVIMLQFAPDLLQVTLHYSDEEKCYYKITDTEEWEP